MRATRRSRVPFETRFWRANDWYIRVTTRARRRHDAPRLAPFFLFHFFFTFTPVIRQLAKEIRIHNSNRFSALSLSRPVGPSFFRRHVRVSKLLSLRVHKVDWTAADPLAIPRTVLYVPRSIRNFAWTRLESMTAWAILAVKKMDGFDDDRFLSIRRLPE